MALHNEIFTGRHNRFLQKLFQLKGRPPAPQLSSEISVSHSIFHGQENRFIESWNLWGIAGAQLAAAALNSEAQLRNPSSSNIVAVVTLVSFGTTAAGAQVTLEYGQQNTDKATVLIARAMDGRVGSTARGSNCIPSIGNSNNGQIGTTVGAFSLPTNTSVTLPLTDNQEIVLSPGDVLLIQDRTQNDTLTFTFWWRERALEESELK